MSWNWLARQWQDISGNVKFAVLLLLGTAIMSAATALIHGLATWQQVVLVALFTLIFGWALIATFHAHPTKSGASDVTTENVEPHVRQWLDNFEVTTQKLSATDKFYFGYLVTYPNGIPIFISRMINRDQYLIIQGTVELSKEHKVMFDKLSEAEKKRFILELRAEISRAKIHSKWELPTQKITVVKLLPITTLTEGELIDQMDGVLEGVQLVIDTINLGLEHGIQEAKPPPANQNRLPISK
jgi:hypothetical protein